MSIVMKFGGSSLADAEKIGHCADLVKERTYLGPVVVVSALWGVTDLLLDAAEKSYCRATYKGELDAIAAKHYDVIKKLGIKSVIDADVNELKYNLSNPLGDIKAYSDLIASYGERMASKIFAAVLNKKNMWAEACNSYDVGLLSNSGFGEAEVLEESYQFIRDSIFFKRQVPVITGFIAKDRNGSITTMGRDGSNYTASVFGVALNASEIQIWSDIDGVMTANPKVVEKAKTVPRVSFREAQELAYFGTKILHPKSIIPAMTYKIPVKIFNTFNPKGEGTTIYSDSFQSDEIVKAVSCKKNVDVVNISSTRMLNAYGFLERSFAVFSKYKKPVDMISTSEVNISLTIDNGNSKNEKHKNRVSASIAVDQNKHTLEQIVDELREFSDVEVKKDNAIVCCVGEGMKNVPGVATRVFSTVANKKINIEMISQGASEISIGFVVDCRDADNAVKALHYEFFERQDNKT